KFPNYGSALKFGIKESTGNLVTIVNVDFWDVDFIKKSLILLNSPVGPDLVVGSKHLEKTSDSRNLGKKFVSLGFNLLLKILFDFKGTDTHGVKTFKRYKFARIVNSSVTSEFVFDTELVLRASSAGFKIV